MFWPESSLTGRQCPLVESRGCGWVSCFSQDGPEPMQDRRHNRMIGAKFGFPDLERPLIGSLRSTHVVKGVGRKSEVGPTNSNVPIL